MNTMVADPLVGRTVDRRYRVEARVATGGMATVYRATDLRLERDVALKVMKPALAGDPEFVQRFRGEARAAARLSHPNVVGVHDQGEADGLVYLAMEFVPGRTLREVLAEGGALAPEQAVAVVDQVLQALEAAHRAGFLHRDVKPENVLVADSGIVKVTDFGLARALESSSSATRGVLIGTAAYLAPEQVSDGRSDERTDVYQAGVLLYELLTGRPPHSGESPWAVAYQHVNTDVPPVSASRPAIDPELDRLVAQATTRNRDRRIASVPQFLHQLRQVARRLPPPVPIARPTTVLSRPGDTTEFARPQPPASPRPEERLTDGPATFPPPPPEVPTPAEVGPGEPAKPRARRRAWRVGVLVVAVLVVVSAAAGWFVAYGNPFDRTDVPQVVGATEEKALAALRAVGFRAEVTERQFSEDVPAGIVIASDPEQGSGAQTGTTVALVLSLGPERYEVPDLKGKSPEDASTLLTATNLVVGGEREAYHDDIAEGLIVRTSPKAGKRVRRDTGVELVVSKGPAPVAMPDLSGLTSDQARSRLDEAGLKVDVSREESSSVAEGGVISFSPRAGSQLHRGDTVEMVVSKGPPPVTVPNVVDMPRADAVAKLEAMGFDVEISEGFVTPLNRVYSQDPVPGAVVAAGSTITLSIF
jgi:serine/threonine-protein kinase